MPEITEDRWGGRWSVKKLDSVERYLDAYLKALDKSARTYGWELLYIDAFSGSGSQRIKVEHAGEADLEGNSISDFVEGSTMRALEVTGRLEAVGVRGFDRFEFFDKDQAKLLALSERVKSSYPSLYNRCHFHAGDSNVLLPGFIDETNWSDKRGVVFIDPYSAQFNRILLERIAATHSLDVWLLFPLSAIGRMMAIDRERIDKSWEKKLDDFFGSHDWCERLYAEERQMSLFDEGGSRAVRESGYSELLAYTKEWLESIFGEGNVLDSLRLMSTNNSPLFALIAAISSRSTSAIDVWRRIAGYILKNARLED